MGFHKLANASVTKASINMGGWDEVRATALGTSNGFKGRRAGQVVQDFKADDYLLSHCTIIASVDVESPKGAQLGRQMVEGVQIDRKYADYLISEETTKYVNNNHDAWERKLLLASFPTFIGGENYVEHVQIPELSKGKIIDAAARDIGDSIYVDILVATQRIHKPLIAAIESGELSTLSMGAQVAFTICSKCGNVAEDEIQLCHHIKYQKGNYFIDTMGKRRKIAELCGHITCEPGSCKFIEGSWVGNPAFPGAVVRNLLVPSLTDTPEMQKRMQVAFSQPTRAFEVNGLSKAARVALGFSKRVLVSDDLPFVDGESRGDLSVSAANSTGVEAELRRQLRYNQIKEAQEQAQAQGQSQGQADDFGFGTQDQAAPEAEQDSFSKSVKEVKDNIVDKAKSEIKDELNKDDQDETRQIIDENSANESLIKSAASRPEWKERARRIVKLANGNIPLAKKLLSGMILFEGGGWKQVAKARKFTGAEILAIAHMMDRLTKKASMAGDSRIYSTVIAVGGTSPYSNDQNYLDACRRVIGRDLTESEKIQLVFKGHLFGLGL